MNPNLTHGLTTGTYGVTDGGDAWAVIRWDLTTGTGIVIHEFSDRYQAIRMADAETLANTNPMTRYTASDTNAL